jgi:uncharacterized membrane protein
METRKPSERVLPNLLKTLGYFALFEAIFCLIVALLFKIALNEILRSFCVFFLAALLSLPWILSARQFIHKPKVYASLAAIGVSLFAALIVVAMQFSGMFKWMFAGGISRGELFFVATFAATITAVSGYRKAQKIANSKRA